MIFETLVRKHYTLDNDQELMIFYAQSNLSTKLELMAILENLNENNLKLDVKMVNLDLVHLTIIRMYLENNKHNKLFDFLKSLNVGESLMESVEMLKTISNKLGYEPRVNQLFYDNIKKYIN